MIDFEKATVFKLHKCDPAEISSSVAPLAIDGEELVAAFKGARDHVVFTNKRVIAVNVQGVTGKKRDFTSLPYSKVQARLYVNEGPSVNAVAARLGVGATTVRRRLQSLGVPRRPTNAPTPRPDDNEVHRLPVRDRPSAGTNSRLGERSASSARHGSLSLRDPGQHAPCSTRAGFAPAYGDEGAQHLTSFGGARRLTELEERRHIEAVPVRCVVPPTGT